VFVAEPGSPDSTPIEQRFVPTMSSPVFRSSV